MSKAVVSRVEAMFDDRATYEALWETAYRYIAPERASFFRKAARSPNEIQDEVFDSTAIDAAERLANLILSGLVPPWMKWFRLQPGAGVAEIEAREEMAPVLSQIENRGFAVLSRSNFYQEVHSMLMDRIVGGTSAMCMEPDFVNQTLRFKCVPLPEFAVAEDSTSKVVSIARKYQLSYNQLVRKYRDVLPADFLDRKEGKNTDKAEHWVYELVEQTVTGEWESKTVLKDGAATLESSVSIHPYLFVTRWAKIPGSVYGRGPGLRALSDVRALNKIKELSLKNAALAVSGVYTVVDDGVLNPYTISLEPGTMLPVASNDLQSPTISVLPTAGNFDVSMFTMDDLRSSIKAIFLNDQYGPTDRTPMSATEVVARTRVIAQDLGATVSRLQEELLLPLLRGAFYWMGQMGLLPPGVEIDDDMLRVQFVSQLAQAQWAQDEQNLMEYLQTAVAFGEVDPKAGLIIDVHKALAHLAELKHIPPGVRRTLPEIEEIMEQATQAQAQLESQGQEMGMPPGGPVGMG